MSTDTTRSTLVWPDFYDALDGIPRWLGRGLSSVGVMRLEEYMDDGDCVIRAEIPGVDPANDIDITINDTSLSISAERKESTRDAQRSEFHYGSFVRHITLPRGARSDQVEAQYVNGVLEVRVPVEEPHPTWKHVPISSTTTGTAVKSGKKGH